MSAFALFVKIAVDIHAEGFMIGTNHITGSHPE